MCRLYSANKIPKTPLTDAHMKKKVTKPKILSLCNKLLKNFDLLLKELTIIMVKIVERIARKENPMISKNEYSIISNI